VRVTHASVGLRRVVSVTGAVDMGTAPDLRLALEEALSACERDIWLDLSALRFMDSSGLHELLAVRERLAADGRRLALIAPAGPVRRMLELSGASRLFVLFPDRPTAHRLS
jgi:anti-sigma B factor antagonist